MIITRCTLGHKLLTDLRIWMKVESSQGSTSQCRSLPTTLSLGMVVISLRAEIRVSAPSLRMNSCSWDKELVARMSSSRKSEKK